MRKNIRKGVVKKACVLLLTGPMSGRDLSRRFGGPVPFQGAKRKGLVDKAARGGDMIWSLSPKGTQLAVKWSYDMKLRNEHPDQEPAVTVPGKKAEELPSSNAREGSHDWFGQQKDKVDTNWQLRHIEFLEEIVRNLTSKGQ